MFSCMWGKILMVVFCVWILIFGFIVILDCKICCGCFLLFVMVVGVNIFFIILK